MVFQRKVGTAICGVVMMLITSCSNGITIEAEVSNGNMYFYFYHYNTRKPIALCIESAHVVNRQGLTEWQLSRESSTDPCHPESYIKYGEAPVGVREIAKARHLAAGEYTFSLMAHDGYQGQVKFVSPN